jgi:hypothetical protein
MSSQFKRLSHVLAKSFNLGTEELVQSFRLATVEEIPAVSNMRRQVFGPDISDNDEDYLKWRYFRHAEFASTLWIFEYQGAIIAAMGTEPVELINCGKHEPAIRSMDAIVDPEYDNRGLGAWMSLVLQERHKCILVCGGNDNSRSMLRKLFHSLPARQSYKFMLASNGYLKKKSIAPIADIVAPAINLLLACHHRLKWLKLSTPTDVEVRAIDTIDELIALLPDTPGLLGTVKVHRSGRYLAWRYGDNPQARFMVVGVFKQAQLLGYVIYTLNIDNAAEAINVGRIVDWDIFSQDAGTEILISLYLEVIKYSRLAGAEQIFITLNDKDSADAAEKAGFIIRESDSELFVYYKDAKPDDPIYSPDRWYQSISDSDAEGI